MSQAISSSSGISPQDKDTAKYIQYLMEGTGTSVNYEQIRDELNQHSRSINQSDMGTVSLMNSDTQNTSTLEQFSNFLKVFQRN
jgi:hypothetical protein